MTTARLLEPKSQHVTASMLVCFSVGEHSYALPLIHVRELLRTVAIAPLPDASDAIVGVINFRGQVIPVVSARIRLSLEPREPNLADRIIVVDVGNRTIGLLVDDVVDVLTNNQVGVQAVSTNPTDSRAPWVATVDGRSIPILDLEQWFRAS